MSKDLPDSGDALLAQIVEAGGKLRVEDPASDLRAVYRRAIWQIQDQHLAPEGKRLRYTGRDRNDLVIWLEDPGESAAAETLEVVVPDRLTRPHPIVAATRDQLRKAGRDQYRRRATTWTSDVFDVAVTDANIGRAMRLLQAMVSALEARGHTATDQESSRPRWWSDKHAYILINGHPYHLKLVEKLDATEHEPTSTEVEEAARPFGRRPPKYDYEPSSHLQVELDQFRDGRRRRWSDTTRWRLDDKLGDIILELETRARLDTERDRQRQADEHARQLAHQQRLEQARIRIHTVRLEQQLLTQAETWDRASRNRAYCDALQQRHDQQASPNPAVNDWIAWAQTHADDIDPLVTDSLPTIPAFEPVEDYQVEAFIRTGEVPSPARTLTRTPW